MLRTVAATTSARTVRALLKISTLTEVAKALEVSVRVVKRWAAQLPATEREKIRKAYSAARVRESELRSDLRRSPAVIATQFGVSERTAKSWKSKRSVTPNMRRAIPLLDALLPQEPVPKSLTTTQRDFHGRIVSSGSETWTEVNAFLSPKLARVLVSLVLEAHSRDRVIEHPQKTYQITLKGDAPEALELASQTLGGPKKYTAYNTKPLLKRRGKGRLKRGDLEQVVVATFAHSQFADVVSDFKAQLTALDAQGLYIQTLSVWSRVPRGEHK